MFMIAFGLTLAVQTSDPPPPPPSFAGAHAGIGRQPDRIEQRHQFTCGTRRWEAAVEVSPTIRPGTVPSVKLSALAFNGAALDAGRRAQVAAQVARLASVETVAMRCDEGGSDTLLIIGDVMDAQGRRTPSRVRARLTPAGSIGVTLEVH